jgi:hypothetical protein
MIGGARTGGPAVANPENPAGRLLNVRGGFVDILPEMKGPGRLPVLLDEKPPVVAARDLPAPPAAGCARNEKEGIRPIKSPANAIERMANPHVAS